MSFLQAASGFATGFADELIRQQDIQREEDRRVEEELLTNLRTQAQTYSERRRQHEEMLRNSHQLHQLTGVADPGAFFQILQLGVNPREAIGMIQSNPNLFREMGINTTQEPPVGSQTGQPNAAIQPTSDVSMGRILPSGLYVSTGTRSQYSPSQNTINIAMDFNAAPSGDARGTEVIIPDNASPEVRAAAERFNALVADFARRNGIEDYPIRGIRTTSENGRGVRNTVHAEPFFNTDIAMQRAIQDNPAEFAMIYDQAFGGIPNARLIAPHGVGRDRGATSPVFGDETTFGELMANALLSQEQGQSPAGLRATVSTSGALDPTDAQMSSAFSGQAPAPQGQPQQEQSGFDRFRTGVQRVFGMDDQSRQDRIQSRVADRARSYGLTLGDGTGPSSGMGGGSGQGFASPPTNFRMNLAGAGADLSPLVGRDADYIDQWMVLNGGNLSAPDLERVQALRDISNRTEENPFDVFEELRQATTEGQFTALSEYVRLSPAFSDDERADMMTVLNNSRDYREQARNGNLMDRYQNDLVRYQRMLTQGTEEERAEAARWFNEERPIMENALGAAGQINARAEATMLEGLGFEPNIAMLAALGHLEVITDPVTREHRVVDSAGNVISRVSADGTQVATEAAQGSVTELARTEYTAARDAAESAIITLVDEMAGADISQGLGLMGRFKNFANVLAGALGSTEARYPETDTAYRLLETMDVYTRLIVTQSLTNLRGSVYVLEMLQELNLTPGEFITAQGAQQRLSTIRQRIADDVRNLEDTAAGRTGAQPSAVSDARAALPDMRTLLSYYEAMEQSFDTRRNTPSSRNFLGNQGQETPATEAAPAPEPNQAVLNQARDAIARGANREAVIQRLIENGIDPSGL